jgi:hypothetical protein
MSARRPHLAGVTIVILLCLGANAQVSEVTIAPFPSRIEQHGDLNITVSEIRTVMRGPMFPSILRFRDDSVIITGSAAEEGGKTTSIRSADNGATWTEEINFAPFFTTGYTGLVPTGPGEFLCVFDAVSPQPWTRHAAHWIGVVDITIEPRPPEQ